MIQKKINNYSLSIFENKEELNYQTALIIARKIKKSLETKDRFQICLCGGSTPKSVYKLLSEKQLSWEKVDVFLGDERCVAPGSKDSNSSMLRNSLLQGPGSKAFFYEIFKDKFMSESESKKLFIEKLNDKCSGNPPKFDLILLGLGNDGHTASLFPYNNDNNNDDLVIYSYGNGLKRISLTPKIISVSSNIIFLVSGLSKRLALKRLIDITEDEKRTPAKLIKSNSEILIYCDSEAANDL